MRKNIDNITYSDIENILRNKVIDNYFTNNVFTSIINDIKNPKHYYIVTKELLNVIGYNSYQEELENYIFVKNSNISIEELINKEYFLDDVIFHISLKSYCSDETLKYYYECDIYNDKMYYDAFYDLIVLHFLELYKHNIEFNINNLFNYLYENIFKNTFINYLTPKSKKYFHQITKELLIKLDKYTSDNKEEIYFNKYKTEIGKYFLVSEDGIPFEENELIDLEYDPEQIINVDNENDINELLNLTKLNEDNQINSNSLNLSNIIYLYQLSILEYLNKSH